MAEADTRRRLLLGALRAFQARGIRAVSTTEVARELGVSKATLYAHYPSKEDLVRDALMHVLDDLWARGQAAAAAEHSPRDKLKAFFAVVTQASRDFPPGVLHDLAREYPKLQRELFEYRAQRLGRLSELLDSAQRRGQLRADVDVPSFVRVLQALVDTMTTPEFQERAGLTPQEAPRYVGMLIDGLFMRKEQPE